MAIANIRVSKVLKVGLAGVIALGLVAGGCSSVRRPGRAAGTPRDAGALIGVNAYLWRAALDTLAFMPLSSVDPYSGIIITDWYANPEKPDERFKATVYILDTRLRADGLNVAINRQVKNGNDWVEAPTAADTEDRIEDQILVRARQIRISGH